MEYLQFVEHLAICKGKKGIDEYFADPDIEYKEDESDLSVDSIFIDL